MQDRSRDMCALLHSAEFDQTYWGASLRCQSDNMPSRCSGPHTSASSSQCFWCLPCPTWNPLKSLWSLQDAPLQSHDRPVLLPVHLHRPRQPLCLTPAPTLCPAATAAAQAQPQAQRASTVTRQQAARLVRLVLAEQHVKWWQHGGAHCYFMGHHSSK